MNNHDHDYIPAHWSNSPVRSPEPKKTRRGIPTGVFLSVVAVVAVLCILLTYTLTSASKRSYYSEKLEAQQSELDALKESLDTSFPKLQLFSDIFDRYSYYANEQDEEALITAVLKAYAEATGDLYAEYYTEEEYRELTAENVGDYEGIGVSVIQTTLTVDGYEYQVFQIIAIYENAPAQDSDLQVGDYIYCIKNADGTYQTVAALGGYTQAINMIKGEKGTQAEFAAFRKTDGGYESIEYSITRDEFESLSVDFYVSSLNPTVGVVHISSFDMTTPHQFKEAVKSLQEQGIAKFVFDVRNNPGGDLQSIKAVMSYFLKKGDLILSAINSKGQVAASYYAEPMKLTGDYAGCSVAEEEVGMFAELDMVVLCNGNTASAAEVFTATLRDYGLAKIVGETTFGKGIMQSIFQLSRFDPNFTGYVKLTTYAYVTKCGVTYHEIGIAPDEGCEVALSEEAKQYNIYVLPEELDDQLKTAVAQLQ